MNTAVKLLFGGAIVGGIAYVLMDNQRKAALAVKAQQITTKAQNVERALQLGKDVIGFVKPEGMTKDEYTQSVIELYSLLPNMMSDDDIEDVRVKLDRLAKADRRWSVLASIVREGTTPVA